MNHDEIRELLKGLSMQASLLDEATDRALDRTRFCDAARTAEYVRTIQGIHKDIEGYVISLSKELNLEF